MLRKKVLGKKKHELLLFCLRKYFQSDEKPDEDTRNSPGIVLENQFTRYLRCPLRSLDVSLTSTRNQTSDTFRVRYLTISPCKPSSSPSIDKSHESEKGQRFDKPHLSRGNARPENPGNSLGSYLKKGASSLHTNP